MFCEKCGREIPEDSIYCAYCGIRLPPEGKASDWEEEARLREPKAPEPLPVVSSDTARRIWIDDDGNVTILDDDGSEELF